MIAMFQVPVYKEPEFKIPGTPAIVQHEILNNRRHVLTKVLIIMLCNLFLFLFSCHYQIYHAKCFEILCSDECNVYLVALVFPFDRILLVQ